MPAYPRHRLIDHTNPGVILVTLFCAGTARLAGRDPESGRTYHHRRQWMLDRLKELQESFAVEAIAWALTEKSVHLLLYIRPGLVHHWTPEEVVWRWLRLFGKGHGPMYRELCEDFAKAHEQVAIWRHRLGSISWFMRGLSEAIARRAVAETGEHGPFWASRFSSRQTGDEELTALLGLLVAHKATLCLHAVPVATFPGLAALPSAPPALPPSQVGRRPEKLNPSEMVSLLQRLETGASISTVAKGFGLTEPTVRKYARRYGMAPPVHSQRLTNEEKDHLTRIIRSTRPDDHGLLPVSTRNPATWKRWQAHKLAEKLFGRKLSYSRFSRDPDLKLLSTTYSKVEA